MPSKPDHLSGDSRNRPIWQSQKIEHMPIEDLTLYENEIQSHSEKSFGHLTDSIAEFGFVVPAIIDDDNNVIAGHGRIEAAKRLKMTTIPTICAEHLTPAQIKAYRIADNRLAELSDWNEDALQNEFDELLDLSQTGDLDFSLDITGFELPEIDIILGGAGDAESEPEETVEALDPATPTVTKFGDLWMLGQHRLHCGDALQPQSYETLLDGETCRMVFTDPPYNVPVNGHVRSGNAGAHREFAMASGEMSENEFRTFLSDVMERLNATLVQGGIAMVCMDWRHIEELIAAGKATGFELINLCVWNKTNGGMGSLYRSKHEMVTVFKKPGAPHINNVEL